MEDDLPARLVLTDEPYNVKISGHVTGGNHREFAMASGEMSDAEFLAFNEAWMATVLPCLCNGGIFGTFIDWRGLPIVHLAAVTVGLAPSNLIVWAKTNAGMGSLYRSQHELLPLFKNGSVASDNTIARSQKNALKPHRSSTGSFRRPERRLRGRMEDVLDVYQMPRDADVPLVCLDEASKQSLQDSRADPDQARAPRPPRLRI